MTQPEPSEREQQAQALEELAALWTPELGLFKSLQLVNAQQHAVAIIAAIRAGAASLRSEAGLAWQPIETAPKDVEVLVFDEGVITISLWIDEDGEGDDGRLKGWWEQSSNSLIDPPPTHWMPLPDPPVALLASAQDGEK